MYVDTPRDYISRVYDQLVYGEEPLGWNILGSKETINAVSIRAFGKAGFRPVREIAGEWGPELLMRVEREDVLIGRATGPSRRTA